MKKNVIFTENGLKIGEKEYPLYSGSVHYWRMDPEHWSRVLDGVKNMGFSIVETYIPWRIHEPVRGEFDFGEKNPRNDLEKFLYLCEEKGLYVIVRPGPHINAEMTLFGYPDWLLEREEIQAKSPEGTPVVYPYVTKQFPVPSYASPEFYEETRHYFGALGPILRRHCYPDGGIVLIQADNETCNFFRDHPYVLDYSAASAELFHQMLEEKYEQIQRLNQAYGTSYENFSQVILPSCYQEGEERLEPYFDWTEYKEYQIRDSLKRMLTILEELKLPIPVFHNCAYQEYTPISVYLDEQLPGLDVAGMDAYPDPGDTSMLKERIRYLSGSSRLPFVPEFGSGSWFDRGLLLSPDEELFGYLYAFANGMKAVNFYMLADRNRWTGCPLRNDGSMRTAWFSMFRSLMNMLKKEEIYRFQRKPSILIVKNYDMGRLKALLSLRDRNTFSSNCFIKGTDIPEKLFHPEKMPDKMVDTHAHYGKENWILKVMDALDACHQEYDITDSLADLSVLKKYDLIFASSYDWMQPEVWKKYVNFAALPGKNMVVGPVYPISDRAGNPLKNMDGEGRIRLLKDPGDLRKFCEKEKIVLPEREYECSDPVVELAVHERQDTGEQILFLVNPSEQERTADIFFSGHRKIRALPEETGMLFEKQRCVRMQPWEIILWKIEQEGKDYA